MGDIVRLVRKGKFVGWYVRYMDADGTRRMRASHQPTRELARRYLLEIEGRVARGSIGIPEPSAALTVTELVERFLAEYNRPRIKDLAEYRVHARKNLQRALPMLGTKTAAALQSADIVRLRNTITHTHAMASVRATLAYLATMFAWAVKLGIVPSNPLRGVERPVPQPSIDFFSHAEVTTFLRVAVERTTEPQTTPGPAIPKFLACCVHLAVHTGLRKGELIGLRWQDLDLDTLRLTVARSYKSTPKSGKTRHLRLPPICVPMLRAWHLVCPQTPDGLVFPFAGGNRPQHALLGLPTLLAAAKVRCPPHPWHAMRHTFASHYVMQGGNILALQRILGHSDIKMTMIYAHLAPDFLGAEMGRLKF